MLCPADAALARRDTAIPGLALVLDPEALAARLRAGLPETGVESLRPIYARYKPGTSCVVAYRVRTSRGELAGHALALSGGDREKLDKRARAAIADGPDRPGVVTLDDAMAGFAFYPDDPDLPGLARAARPGPRRELLRRMLPGRPELWDAALTPLRHKPARRFVGRLDTPAGPAAALKIHRPGEVADAAWRRAGAFRSRGALRLARPLGRSRRRGAVALEWLAGRGLSEWIEDGAAGPDAVALAAAALAELHGQRPAGLPAAAPAADVLRAEEAAGAVEALAPDMSGRAREIAARLARRLRGEPRRAVPLHGDFSADQVIVADDSAALIDLDQAVLGDPAADLGAFRASLRGDALEGRLTMERAETLAEHLVAGHRDGLRGRLAPPPPSLVDVHTAACLLRLAVEPFRRREPRWEAGMAAILDDARGVLDAS